MTIKVLTGSYSSGYTLQRPVTILTLAASGYIGGTGLGTTYPAPGPFTIVNLGKIVETTSPYNGNGVYLGDGGKLTNGSSADRSASISGYRGVKVAQALGTVTNFGTIAASYRSGVFLAAGGSVTNGSVSDKTASISSAVGYSLGISCGDYDSTTYKHSGIGSTVTNFGTVTGGTGVQLLAGGMLTNGSASDTAALVRGVTNGLFIYSYTGAETATVVNFGTIAGGATSAYNSGVKISSLGATSRLTNGSVNDAAALITGNIGVDVYGASETVINFGTIQGFSGVAVYFEKAGDKLILEAGSTLLGGFSAAEGSTIDAVGGIATIVGDLANAGAITGVGTLSVEGAVSVFSATSTVSQAQVVLGGEAYLTGDLNVADKGFLTARSLVVAASGLVSVTGAGSALVTTGGAKIAAGGMIDAAAGTLVEIKGAVSNAGVLEVTGGTMELLGAISGAGSSEIMNGALQIAGPTIGTVAFTGTTGVLELGLPELLNGTVTFHGSVSGLSTSGKSSLDLLTVPDEDDQLSYVDNGHKTGGVLTVTPNGPQGQTAVITLIGDYVGGTFSASSDGGGGSTITYSAADIPSPHVFTAAMAGFGAPAFAEHIGADRPLSQPQLIVAPRPYAQS